jgi:hypothetical protein
MFISTPGAARIGLTEYRSGITVASDRQYKVGNECIDFSITQGETMVKFLKVAAVVGTMFAAAGPVMAADSFWARMRGSEEVPVIVSTGQGVLIGTLNDAETQLDYQLFYTGLGSNATQSHIHIGQTSVTGAIVLFFCTNLTPPPGVPAPPACPNGAGFQSVTGSLTAANVVTQAAQGVAAGAFADVVKALKAGNAYANLHTVTFPGGEIRGQLTR